MRAQKLRSNKIIGGPCNLAVNSASKNVIHRLSADESQLKPNHVMKKIFLLLAVAALAFSPAMVSTAQAGQGKHAHAKAHKGHHHHHHGKKHGHKHR